MLRSYKVIGRFSVTDRFGTTHNPEFYQKIHRNVQCSRQAWEEATEDIMKRARVVHGGGCQVNLLTDIKILHHREKEKPAMLTKKAKDVPVNKRASLSKKTKTDREIILETRREMDIKSNYSKKMKWDLMKDQISDEEIKTIKDSPFDPENRWALTVWKKRVKDWLDKLQLKLFS